MSCLLAGNYFPSADGHSDFTSGVGYDFLIWYALYYVLEHATWPWPFNGSLPCWRQILSAGILSRVTWVLQRLTRAYFWKWWKGICAYRRGPFFVSTVFGCKQRPDQCGYAWAGLVLPLHAVGRDWKEGAFSRCLDHCYIYAVLHQFIIHCIQYPPLRLLVISFVCCCIGSTSPPCYHIVILSAHDLLSLDASPDSGVSSHWATECPLFVVSLCVVYQSG